MTIKNIYHETLRDHYLSPRNRGTLTDCNIQSGVQNPSCGDSVNIQGYVDQEQILRKIVFEGNGCIISQAAASLITEYVKNKSLQEIQAITTDEIRALVGIELGPTRLRCAFLTLEAIQHAILQKT